MLLRNHNCACTHRLSRSLLLSRLLLRLRLLLLLRYLLLLLLRVLLRDLSGLLLRSPCLCRLPFTRYASATALDCCCCCWRLTGDRLRDEARGRLQQS